MKHNSKNYGRDSGSSRFNNKSGNFRNNNYEQREMHKTKCADCGAECQVPFVPKEDRPVYCRDCYQNHKPARY